ncbi:MAG: hypothetical protein ACRDXX_10590 [Stackebrandtia sp.]
MLGIALAAAAAGSGCAGSASSETPPEPQVAPRPDGTAAAGSSKASDALAGLAAVAKGRSFTAEYKLTRGDGKPKTVEVAVAEDGTWRVDVQGGAHGGKKDVAIVGNKRGYFQCVLEDDEFCAHLAPSDGELPKSVDPVVPHLFTDWLDVWIDRKAPLSIAYAEAWDGVDADSQCFSVEPSSATVSAPLPSGTYCLSEDGVVTAAKAGFGQVMLDGKVEEGSAKTKLPAEVTDDKPLSTSPPPSPTPSKTKDKEDKEEESEKPED